MRGCTIRNPKSVMDTTEGRDDRGKLGQPTDRHGIVFVS